MYKFLLILFIYIAVTNAFENLEIIDQPIHTDCIKYKNASNGYFNNRGTFVYY